MFIYNIVVRLNYAGRLLDLLVLYLELTSGSIHQPTVPINVSALLQDIENMAAAETGGDNTSLV